MFSAVFLGSTSCCFFYLCYTFSPHQYSGGIHFKCLFSLRVNELYPMYTARKKILYLHDGTSPFYS